MKINLFFILSFVFFFAPAQDKKSLVLEVPYRIQPDDKTCQSTCLKMLAQYLDAPGKSKSITQIYNTINKHEDRPNKSKCKNKKGKLEFCKNSWDNIIWWWNTHSGYNSADATVLKLTTTKDESKAIEHIVASIDKGVPLLVSVSNSNTSGHFVLVFGYKNYLKNQSSPDFSIVCHDPYGKFFPELQSKLFGKKRYEGGYSKMDGSEQGPGAGVEIGISSLIKFKASDGEYKGRYVLFGAE